jgi:hypothetical protein
VSIDELGREAGAAARRAAHQDVDPGVMLQRMHRTRRTRGWLVAVGATAVVAVLAAVVAGAATTARNRPVEPAGSPSASASGSDCPDRVECLGDGRYRVPLQVPVTVTLPDGYAGDFARFGDNVVEDYVDPSRSPSGTSGVTIFENAQAVAYDSTWTADRAAGTGALSYSQWWLTRPFLVHTSSTQVRFDGRTGYLLQGSLRPDAAMVVTKNLQPADPTFQTSPGTAAITETLRGVYVVVDTPPAGVTVLWFWSMDPQHDLVADATTYVQHIHFG